MSNYNNYIWGDSTSIDEDRKAISKFMENTKHPLSRNILGSLQVEDEEFYKEEIRKHSKEEIIKTVVYLHKEVEKLQDKLGAEKEKVVNIIHYLKEGLNVLD